MEKPSSELNRFLTTSPSNKVTDRSPISKSILIKAFAIVDLPEPDKPVKKTAKPCLCNGGFVFFNSAITSGKENHSGILRSLLSLLLNSVPDICTTLEFLGTSLIGTYSALSSRNTKF